MATAENFLQLQEELKNYVPLLSKASDAILEQDISNYPILVASKTAIEIGIPLLAEGQRPGKWFLNASTLEEFSVKQLIEQNKIDEFRKVYKNPEEQLCIFAISQLGATFLFLPRIK